MELNINTHAAVIFTNKLEKIRRSALPVAIRGALNDAAFDVKMNTMPKNAAETFTKREPNFFKANSRVEKAVGFNLSQMKAAVGFTETDLRGDRNYAVKDLRQQEYGGAIAGRSFVPMRSARKGGTGVVKPNARISKIKHIVKTKSYKGNIKQKLIQAIVDAGKGGFVLSGKKNILFKIDSLSFLKLNRKRKSHITFKITPLFSFRRKGKPVVKSTGFMKESTLQSGEKMEKFFIQQATRQLNKLI